ncbi:FMRFamide receptor [Biomphalaria glabrata]|nr:FMRFamide receptor-like [Biomphalaria glabrata]
MSNGNTTIQTSRLFDSTILDFFMTFNLLVVGELISIFGIAANVINNRVFYKLGFQESVDITLTALSVSDLGALITIQLANVMVNPWCLAANVPFVPIDFLTLVSFYPHSYLIRVSGFIASFERCLSVMVPLKVKTIITWRTSLVVNTSVFMITILNVFSPYYFSYLGWTFIPERNMTLLVLSLRGDWDSDTFHKILPSIIGTLPKIVLVIVKNASNIYCEKCSSVHNTGRD